MIARPGGPCSPERIEASERSRMAHFEFLSAREIYRIFEILIGRKGFQAPSAFLDQDLSDNLSGTNF
jgi:hypothetical protein